MSAIKRKIEIRSERQGRTKEQKKLDNAKFRQIDESPALIIIHILGLIGICTAVKDAVGLNFGIYLVMCFAATTFSALLWYVYIHKEKTFIYITVALCISAFLTITPYMYRAVYIYRNYSSFNNFANIGTLQIIEVFILIIYFLFTVEFVLRTHSLVFLLVVAALALAPTQGIEISDFAVVLMTVFAISFVSVNMIWSKNPKSSFKMKNRARIGTLVGINICIVIITTLIPSSIVENIIQEDLFSNVSYADAFIKDAAAMFTGNSGSNISGGKVSRGNLNQTGQTMLWLLSSDKPSEQLYLKGFVGDSYQDEEWSSAFNYYESLTEVIDLMENNNDDNNEYDNEDEYYGEITDDADFDEGEEMFYFMNYENCMIDIMKYLPEMIKESWCSEESNDVISSIYYNINSYYYLNDLSSANTFPKLMTYNSTRTGQNELYIPYYSKYSESELSLIRQHKRDTVARYYGEYENYYVPRTEAINISDYYYSNSTLEKFLSAYEEEAKKTYTTFPEKGNERLKQLCDETPLENLDEITTFILYTLQTHASYTTTPGTAPYNRDIIDYFLFDNGKGYCVHFASAAALMYRYYGIPARYVTGYSVNPADFSSESKYTSPDSGYNYYTAVSDYSAHAWVEIFLKDYGWVIVDATPTTSGNMIVRYPEYDTTVMNRIMKEKGWQFKNRSSEESESSQSTNDDGGTGADDSTFETVRYILILAAAVIISAVFLVLRRHIRLKKIPDLKCKSLFDLIIKSVHFCNLIDNYQGHEENFAEIMCRDISVISSDEAEKLIEIMMRVNYSENDETKDDNNFLHELYMRISENLYKNLSWHKKLVFKFVKAYI